MTYQLIHGDARHVSQHVEPASVDLIVTSPPYFALRSYQDGGAHYDGQIGSEPTPAEFLDALVACTADWLTVLKPGGSLWVNLGDKYARTGGVDRKERGSSVGDPGGRAAPRMAQRAVEGIQDKSLMGLPWRYAIRCIDELGLILRAEVIWSKPNGLPESVTDRVRRSHEQWFHFTRQGRYYAAVDEIREPHAEVSLKRAQPHRANTLAHEDTHVIEATKMCNPLGKLPGSVWTVPTEPLRVPEELGIDHFAAFPSEWPRRIILGWSPSGICTVCGEGLRPTLAKTPMEWKPSARLTAHMEQNPDGLRPTGGTMVKPATTTITGYACACDTPGRLRPAVVLDPFGGTGTTAAVAHHLGRHGIHLDLSADYLRLAEWRITSDDRLRRKVLERSGHTPPRPPKKRPDDGQPQLFGGEAA